MSDLEKIAEALGTFKPRLDDDGDDFIDGKYGEIFDDGDVWGIYIDRSGWDRPVFTDPLDIGICREEFSKFMELREEFYTGEETWELKDLPTPEQAAIIRKWVGIPKRRIFKSSSGFEQFVSIYDAAKACNIDFGCVPIAEEELLKYLKAQTYVGKIGEYYIVRVYDNRCGPIRGRENLNDGPEFLTAPNLMRKYWPASRVKMLEEMKKRIKG